MDEKAKNFFLSNIETENKILCLQDEHLNTARFFHSNYEVIVGFFNQPQMPIYDQNNNIQILKKDFFETVFPFRSLHGIISEYSLSLLDKDLRYRFLEKSRDAISLKGYLYAFVHEGEGKKTVVNQNLTGKKELKLQYFSPQDLQNLFSELGYIVIDAWRNNHFIHVIVSV